MLSGRRFLPRSWAMTVAFLLFMLPLPYRLEVALAHRCEQFQGPLGLPRSHGMTVTSTWWAWFSCLATSLSRGSFRATKITG